VIWGSEAGTISFDNVMARMDHPGRLFYEDMSVRSVSFAREVLHSSGLRLVQGYDRHRLDVGPVVIMVVVGLSQRRVVSAFAVRYGGRTPGFWYHCRANNACHGPGWG